MTTFEFIIWAWSVLIAMMIWVVIGPKIKSRGHKSPSNSSGQTQVRTRTKIHS